MTRYGPMLVVALILVPAGSLNAWTPNGVVVCDTVNSQKYPQAVTDDSGGAIVVWQDSVNGQWDIYAQRIDYAGVSLWTPNGVVVCDAPGEQSAPSVASDGAGGAFVVWQDFRGGGARVYGQRLDPLGASVWQPDGVIVCDTLSMFPTVDSDGRGGAVISWIDSRAMPVSWYDVYAQRVDSAGTVLWSSMGARVCSSTGWEWYPQVVSDGSGGAVVVWEDERNDAGDIYAQRLDSLGARAWTLNGIAVCNAAGEQALFQFFSQFRQVVTDDSGGAIVVWHDRRSGTEYDVYAQRITHGGSMRWAPNGVVISNAAGSQLLPVAARDGLGGGVFAWMDSSGTDWNILVQRVEAMGTPTWNPNGVVACGASGSQSGHTLVSDGAGGAIVAWQDQRRGVDRDIYSQRINSLGTAQWAPDGLIISSQANTRLWPAICDDGSGGAIIAWQDSVNGNWDIYAQGIDRNGLVATHDVGPVYIEEPPDTVWCGDTVLVAATVCNFGDTVEAFDVEALVDSSGIVVYADTQTVFGLEADSCISVGFANWVVPQTEGVLPYALTVTTLLPGDVSPAGDTLRKSVVVYCAAYHDVLVDYVDEPWDTVWCGDTSGVGSFVCNNGDSIESFDVEAVIDSGGTVIYADTQMVTGLEPDSCVRVSFAGWPVPGGHLTTFTTTVTARLPSDMNPANDTSRTTSVNWCPEWHDVTAESMSAPPETVLCDSTVQVIALVCNRGTAAETFDVEAVIRDTSGTALYTDTAIVVDLLPYDCVGVAFMDWVVPGLDSIDYSVTIATLLASDDDPGNDTASAAVFGYCVTGVRETAHLGAPVRLFRLDPARPSPTSGTVSLGYALPLPSTVTFRIYDVSGKLIRLAMEDEVPSGLGCARWDGRDDQGEAAPSGVYFYEFRAQPAEEGHAPFVTAGKLIVVR